MNKKQPQNTNIYRMGRQMAGMTQERFAEAIGVSTEAVAQYEAGKIVPSDEVVTRMAEVAGYMVLGYWHLLNKSRVAAELLPEVQHVPVAQAVVNLIRELDGFRNSGILDILIEMAADGEIDDGERSTFASVLEELDGIVQAALMVKYAESEN